MELSGDLLHYLRRGAEIFLLLLLLPLGAYLRQRTYYYTHHPQEAPSIWKIPERIAGKVRRYFEKRNNKPK